MGTTVTEVHDPVDGVVVGAGMGGVAFCHRLSSKAPELTIVCLERGGWVEASEMPATRTDYQRQALSGWSPSPAIRQASPAPGPSADYAIDDSDSVIKPLMWNGVGGSTIAWAAHFPRLHPSDFATRTLDGVGDDWPFGYSDLEPYYDANDEIIGVSGLAGDPAYPPKRSSRMPPVPMGRMGETLARAFNDRGWHWWPVDAAINTLPSDGRGACNNCGPCQQGCVTHAKASADRTYWPAALERGVTLRAGCAVREIVTEDGRATSVLYRDDGGRDHVQPASYVVVACNGIGTPRLLLASGIGGDMVGRCLMFHPVAYLNAVFEEKQDGPAGPIGCCVYSHEFYETDRERGFVRGVQFMVTRENPLFAQSTCTDPGWGRAGQEQLREMFGHSFRVLVMAEDLPEPDNRVILTDQVDDDGMARVKLTYALSENSRRRLDFGLDRAQEALVAAGAVRIDRSPLAPTTGWHLLGTARMGTDPHTSVVDARGRCHTTPNVIVAGGSVFPTVGAVNPGSTIGAVALKIADDLATEMGVP